VRALAEPLGSAVLSRAKPSKPFNDEPQISNEGRGDPHATDDGGVGHGIDPLSTPITTKIFSDIGQSSA